MKKSRNNNIKIQINFSELLTLGFLSINIYTRIYYAKQNSRTFNKTLLKKYVVKLKY